MPDIEKSLRETVDKAMQGLRRPKERIIVKEPGPSRRRVEKVVQVVEKGGRAAGTAGGFLGGVGRKIFGTEEFNIAGLVAVMLTPFRYIVQLIGKYLKIILFIVSCAMALYLLVYFSADMWVWMARGTHCKVGDMGCVIGGIGSNIGTGFSNYKQSLADIWEFQIKKATGQYYTSENENERIGVYLTNVEPGAPTFGVDEPIIVWAELRGEVLEEDLDNEVKIDCVMFGKMDNVTAEHIEPDDLVLADLYGAGEGIDCQFPAYTSQEEITEVSKRVDVTAEFDFTGKGRVVLNFMDENLIREMKIEDKDPNDVYNIPRIPNSYYSGGPVMIGVGTTRTNPIGIKAGRDISTRLGLTLDNNWEGEIVRVKSVKIMPDDGIELPIDKNVLKLIGGPDSYTVDESYLPVLTDDGQEPIKTFISLNFRMALKHDSILEHGTPVTQKEVQIEVVYTYRMKGSTTVELDYIPPLPGELTPEGTGAEGCEPDDGYERKCVPSEQSDYYFREGWTRESTGDDSCPEDSVCFKMEKEVGTPAQRCESDDEYERKCVSEQTILGGRLEPEWEADSAGEDYCLNEKGEMYHCYRKAK